MTRVQTLMDQVVCGFGRLGCERLRQRARGRRVRREAEGGDGGGGQVGTQTRIVSGETRQAARGLRVRGREAGRWMVRRVQGGANGQILFIGHNRQSVSHQAVSHSALGVFSDSTVEKHTKLDLYISFFKFSPISKISVSKIPYYLAYA